MQLLAYRHHSGTISLCGSVFDPYDRLLDAIAEVPFLLAADKCLVHFDRPLERLWRVIKC